MALLSRLRPLFRHPVEQTAKSPAATGLSEEAPEGGAEHPTEPNMTQVSTIQQESVSRHEIAIRKKVSRRARR